MLAENFRSSTERVARIREILSDPIMAAAIVTLKDEAVIEDVGDNSPDIASVRRLSWLSGYNNCIDLLMSLSNPLPAPPQEEVPSWGVPKDQLQE